MKLNGLVTATPQDRDLLIELSNMAGDSGLQEFWVRELLSGFPRSSEGSDRERFLSRAFILNQLIASAPYGAVHCTPDGNGLLVAALKSDLENKTWDQIMKDASANLIGSVFSVDETDAYENQLRRMEGVTVLSWVDREKNPGDFIHIHRLVVNADHQHQGLGATMMGAVTALADELSVPVLTQAYSDSDKGFFERFGFNEVHQFTDPQVSIVEHCMRRDPA